MYILSTCIYTHARCSRASCIYIYIYYVRVCEYIFQRDLFFVARRVVCIIHTRAVCFARRAVCIIHTRAVCFAHRVYIMHVYVYTYMRALFVLRVCRMYNTHARCLCRAACIYYVRVCVYTYARAVCVARVVYV